MVRVASLANLGATMSVSPDTPDFKLLGLGLITVDTIDEYTPDARSALFTFIRQFTDLSNVVSIDLGPNKSVLTTFCTDTNGNKYLVNDKLAMVSWEIGYGFEDIQDTGP